LTRKIAYILFVLIIGSDILSSVASNLNWPFSNFGLVVKTPIEFFLLFYSLKFVKTDITMWVIGSLFLIWLIGLTVSWLNVDMLTTSADHNGIYLDTDSNVFSASFKVFNRYVFVFALAVLMYLYADDDKFVIDIKQLFECFIVVNSICVILGAIFDISMFSAYNPGNKITEYVPRYGYKGLLFGVNEITGIYFLSLAHYYREMLTYKRFKKILPFFILFISAFLTGAKATLLGLFMISAFYLYQYFRKLFFFVFVPLVTLTIIIVATRYMDVVMDVLSTISTSDSLLTVLTSGRSDYVEHNYYFISTHWSFFNYIFGDGSLYTEMDFFDLYLFFGLGAVLYLALYIKTFVKYERSNHTVPVLVLMLLLAFVNGHMLQSAVFPVFLVLFLISSRDTSPEEKYEDSICVDSN